jgi:hypothetical protein
VASPVRPEKGRSGVRARARRGRSAARRWPVVELRVQRADVDAWAGAYFAPACRGRLAQAAGELPAAERDYLAGRSRQALRTNLRHARERGVTSARVHSHQAWSEAARVIMAARPDGRRAGRELDEPGPGQQVAHYVARNLRVEVTDPGALLAEPASGQLRTWQA